MKFSGVKWNALALACALIVACGGGGGGGGLVIGTPGGGIGGTGVTSSGTIDGFGSIFVNGVEFETDSASITVDGDNGTEADLGLGMVVLVIGTVNDDGVTGRAEQVVFDDEVEGPISAIATSTDGETRTLTVLGNTILIERAGTVVDGASFDSLAVDDVIEASGFRDENGQLLATRVEKKSEFVPGSTEVELKGTVENLTATQFTLGEYTVDYSTADLSDVSDSTLSDGMFVEVEGILDGTVITATEVEEEDELGDNFGADDDVSVEGVVTDFVDLSSFRVAGVAVDASNATLSPGNLALANGTKIEAEGRWDGSRLIAEEIELRGAEIRMRAQVESVDTAARTISLQFFGGTVTVSVDSKTRFEDGTDQVENLRLENIAAGDFLRVEALESNAGLLASEIKRDERDDDRLRAPVEEIDPNVSITLLGITYFTAGASFEGAVDEADFYSRLQPGDVVQVDDDLVTDGFADDVELEGSDDSDD